MPKREPPCEDFLYRIKRGRAVLRGRPRPPDGDPKTARGKRGRRLSTGGATLPLKPSLAWDRMDALTLPRGRPQSGIAPVSLVW